MLQNNCNTVGFIKQMAYKIPLWEGGKPYLASCLENLMLFCW